MKREITIPEYLTIQQYIDLQNIPDSEHSLEQALYIISVLTDIDTEELKYWDLDSVKQINEYVSDLIDPKNEFYPLVEWNGVLYGYSNITQQTLGEYIDLENLCKDVNNNLHKIVSILYRPVTKHKFDSLSFQLKHRLKVVRNSGVANVFDGYTIEKYDNEKRKEVEDSFLHFPVTVALGAMSFFLLVGSQYLNNTVSLETSMKMENQKLTESLLGSIGGGSGLSTHSLKPIYLTLQATEN